MKLQMNTNERQIKSVQLPVQMVKRLCQVA